jgi:hypothetical protein
MPQTSRATLSQKSYTQGLCKKCTFDRNQKDEKADASGLAQEMKATKIKKRS